MKQNINENDNKNTFYHTSQNGKDIKLQILDVNADSLEIVATNLNYKYELHRNALSLFAFLLTYSLAKAFQRQQLSIIQATDIISVLLCVYLIFRILNIVHCEKLIIVNELGIQIGTNYLGGRTNNLYIPSSCVHDIVIIDSISNFQVIYSIVILTKNKLYSVTPIIPIMNVIKLRLEMLEIIYNTVQNKWMK